MKMCQAFGKKKHEVVLFAREGAEQADDPFAFYGVEPCFHLEICGHPRARGWGGVKFALNVAKHVNHLGLPDLFYARHVYSLAMVANLSVPMIFEAHTLPENPIQKRTERWLFRRINFRQLIVISNALWEDYQTVFPWISGDKIIVAHDGADPPVAMDKTEPHPWPGRMGSMQVGYVGGLYPGKGMEIIAVLAPEMPDIDFHVIGGTQKDLLYWRKKVSAPNLYFHGFVPHGRLSGLFGKFDVMVAPYLNKVTVGRGNIDISRWMSPLKLFEYMAYAKAIVASDISVLREVLTNQRNSLLCPVGDVAAWKNALRSLEGDTDLRRRIGMTAQKEFLSRYTWEVRAEVVNA